MRRAINLSGAELQVLVEQEFLTVLQEREHELAESQRLAHLGSWVRDVTTGESQWSQELYRILGLPESVEASFETFMSRVQPGDREWAVAAVRRAEASLAGFEFETRLSFSGQSRWVRCRGAVAVEADGHRRSRGTVHDVTETVQGSATLRAFTRHCVSGARAPASADVIAYDRDGRVQFCVAGSAGLTSRDLAALGTGTCEGLVHPDDADRATAEFSRFREDSSSAMGICFRIADGDSWRAVEARGIAVIDHGVPLGKLVTIRRTGDERHRDPPRLGATRASLAGQAGVTITQGAGRDGERTLQRALDDAEFVLHYQPKLSLEAGRITGFEALLRWQDPVRGLVSPQDFIPLAEQTGLIVPIGSWVLAEACRQVAAWHRLFPRQPALVMAVNVSGRQFGPELPAVVRRALADSGAPADRVCLEVTETVLLADTNVDTTVRILRELSAIGVRLSIDDFGTGYSSLAYLKRFPLNELKIDKSFVDGIGTDADDTAIIGATVALAHALGLSVIAEGVETAEQLERLRVIGCQEVQGYFVSRPQPAALIADLLAAEENGTWSARPSGPPPLVPFTPQRILVVDDAADVRQLARMSLAVEGFDVHDAESGAEAIRMARMLRPDCVILDVFMPQMSGMQVCRYLRSDPFTAGCTIIMLTDSADAEHKIEAFSGGADDYIVKPFSPRELVSRVRAALRAKRDADGPVAGWQ